MYALYYFPFTASMAPRYLLEHIGAKYDLVLIDRDSDEQKSKHFLSINPAGRIPAFSDNDLTVFESPAICLHLAETHPESNLIPELGDPNRPLFHQWLMYLTNTLQAELMVYFYPENYTVKTNEKDNISEKLELRISDILRLLDNQLSDKTYLVGDNISACDYYLFMLAVWAAELKNPPLNFKNLKRYLKNLSRNTAIMTVSKKEGLDLTPYQ